MVPIQSPRPTPQFFHPPTFSQRKKTPLRQPPKAPAKTCPPVSRVFTNQRQWTEGPCLISFTSNSKTECMLITVKRYDFTIYLQFKFRN